MLKFLLIIFLSIILPKFSTAQTFNLLDLPLCYQTISPRNISYCTPYCNCSSSGNLSGCNSSCESCKSSNVNCVDECSISNRRPSLEHGVSCITFCDRIDNPDPNTNCSPRKCQQLPDGTKPVPSTSFGGTGNCYLKKCTELSPGELSQSKFKDTAKNSWLFCDPTDKCYNMNLSQLDYTISNRQCKIHNCPYTCPDKEVFDDINIIKAKGTSFEVKYVEKLLPSGTSLTQFCETTGATCDNIVYTQKSCVNNIPDPTCTCKNPSTCCVDGGCLGMVNCTKNPNSPDCQKKNSDETKPTNDPFDAWFYFPTPSKRAFANNDKDLTQYHYLKFRESPTDSRFCLSKGNLKDHNIGKDWSILGYQLGGRTLSPGMCYEPDGLNKDFHDPIEDEWGPKLAHTKLGNWMGFRNLGGIAPCEVGATCSDKPAQSSVYVLPDTKVSATPVFTGVSDPRKTKAKITACLRLTNSGNYASCGVRECRIDCIFGSCTQWCGYDKCYDLYADEFSASNCALKTSTELDKSGEKDCYAEYDGTVRLRARKYGRYVCVFMDQLGCLAYNKKFADFTGTKEIQLDETTTIKFEGETDPNHDPGLAHFWRTWLMADYIGHAPETMPSGETRRGVYNFEGKFFPEQRCALVPLAIGPPRHYKIASWDNSPELFEPPIKIIASYKNGQNLGVQNGEFLPTDFFNPQIKISFGNDVFEMKYTFSSTKDVPTYQTETMEISTTRNGVSYKAKIYGKLESDITSDKPKPIFCLYKTDKTKDTLLDCVFREFPTFDMAKVKLTSDAKYNNQKIQFQYLANPENQTTLQKTCSAQGAICSPFLYQLQDNSSDAYDKAKNYLNADGMSSASLYQYRISIKHDTCLSLSTNCVENDIKIFYAKKNKLVDTDLGKLLDRKYYCEQVLRPKCNILLGLTPDGKVPASGKLPADDSNYTTFVKNRKEYGWFNEICVNDGYKNQLNERKVVALKTTTGVDGKCKISPDSPYLKDGDSSTNCDLGGQAPFCICDENISTANVGDDGNEYIRNLTAHEAGLCVAAIIPKACQKIDFGKNNFVPNSLSKFFYDDNSGVHNSHKKRTDSVSSGHAEFPDVIEGFLGVPGECNGFWTYRKNSDGVIIYPEMDCTLDQSGNAKFTNIKNDCIRYTCPQMDQENKNYVNKSQSQFSSANNWNEIFQNEYFGKDHGFANWPAVSLTDDFAKEVTATRCLTGYAPSQVGNSINDRIHNDSNPNGNAANIINQNSYYLPKRNCMQNGVWDVVKDVFNYPSSVAAIYPNKYFMGTSAQNNGFCERLYCNSISLGNILSLPSQDYNLPIHKQSGGAIWPETPASKKSGEILYVVGNCQSAKDYYKLGTVFTPQTDNIQYDGAYNPVRGCNMYGVWEKITNQCVKSCPLVTSPTPAYQNPDGTYTHNDPTNGGAKWDKVVYDPSNPSYKYTGECVAAGSYLVSPSGLQPQRTCGLDGNWSAVENPCYAASTCKDRDEENAKWWGGLMIYGSDRQIDGECNSGYSGNPKRTCDKYGNWGAIDGKCQRICNAVNTGAASEGFANWNQWYNNNYYTYGTCIAGYKADKRSLPRRACQSDGTFTSVEYPCVPTSCPADGIWPATPIKYTSFVSNQKRDCLEDSVTGGATWGAIKSTKCNVTLNIFNNSILIDIDHNKSKYVCQKINSTTIKRRVDTDCGWTCTDYFHEETRTYDNTQCVEIKCIDTNVSMPSMLTGFNGPTSFTDKEICDDNYSRGAEWGKGDCAWAERLPKSECSSGNNGGLFVPSSINPKDTTTVFVFTIQGFSVNGTFYTTSTIPYCTTN